MSRKMLMFSISESAMKIYDYRGRKNLCGDRVREMRLKKRLSQSALAAKLQLKGIVIERDSISRIESGTRFVSDYELKALSEVLGVGIDWLLTSDEPV